MLDPDPDPDSMIRNRMGACHCHPCEPSGSCYQFVTDRKKSVFVPLSLMYSFNCNKISGMFKCVGKTKVFLRSCVHEPLEERRRQVLWRSATLIQKIWRGVHQCRRYRQIRQAAKRIQVSDRIVRIGIRIQTKVFYDTKFERVTIEKFYCSKTFINVFLNT
jgi:hypothetical protein